MSNHKTEGFFTSFIHFFRSKKGAFLIPLFIGYALFELSTIPLFIYGQPFFSMQGLEVPVIAGIYAAVEAISAGMFMAAGFICSRFSLGIIAFTTTSIVTILLFILSLNIGIITSIVTFLLIMSLPALYETSYETYIHDNVESPIRASCLSFANLVVWCQHNVADRWSKKSLKKTRSLIRSGFSRHSAGSLCNAFQTL